MTFTPSPQQAAVIDFVKNGKGSAFVEAVAGAGKTTTLIQAIREARGYVAFCAYNKKISDEIAEKVSRLNLGNRVRVGTFHSFGWGAWRRAYPKCRLDGRVKQQMVSEFVRNLLQVEGDELVSDFKVIEPVVHKLIGFAKQRGLGLFGQIGDTREWHEIVDHFDLAYEIEDESLIDVAIRAAIAGLRHSCHIAKEIIDFDDMIYMPIVTGAKMWGNDWVFVDEAQDTNPSRRALVRKMLSGRGRALFVGDRHQAIYGFTGADNDAIDQIIRDFRCTTLPLTVTYRCPKAVVDEARQVVSHIRAHETAPQGSTVTIEEPTFLALIKDLDPNRDAIICRNTKPLVALAYQMIRNGVGCYVEGRDIGVGLIKLANRWSVKNIESLRDKLTAYSERETGKLIAKGKEIQAQMLSDRVDTLLAIMDGCHTRQDLTDRISSLFKDEPNKHQNSKNLVTLCTAHRSKGREWDRVFLLGRNLYMPSVYARQQWQQDQENNLIYVAITRAKETLVYVDVTKA